MDKTGKRSPLKEKPLRHAGQSLDEDIDRILSEEVDSSLAVSFAVIMLAAFEWIKFFTKIPPQPVGVTIGAIIAIAYAARKIVISKRKIKLLKMARDGEKSVGQYLELLREQGCQVLHDIVGDGFNVDHLVIAPQGIFTIETKTVSKPAKGKTVITFDETGISINGAKPHPDAIIQAKAEAQWIKAKLKEMTSHDYWVRPVIIYPDWYVKDPKRDWIWVLNQQLLPSYIQDEKIVLKPSDIALAYSSLASYIRNKL